MATHGGSRPGAGRPYDYREPLRRVTVALPESSIEQLRASGQGNLSEGIRRLVEEALTPAGKFWYHMPEWAKDGKASHHPPKAAPPKNDPSPSRPRQRRVATPAATDYDERSNQRPSV